jgi:hypothetical protein
MARSRLLGSGMRQLCLALAVGMTAGLSCSEDGTTAKCPDIPRYDIYKADAFDDSGAHLDPDIEQAREEAVAAGCLTAIGHATSAGGSAGGGAAGAPGDSGSD